MSDLDNRLRTDQKSARLRAAHRQLHQIDLALGLAVARPGLSQQINRIRTRSQQFQPTTGRTERVLLVEDESANRTAFAVVFARLHLAVDHTEHRGFIIFAEVVQFPDEELLRRQRDHLVGTALFDAEEAVELVAGNDVVALDRGADVAVLAVPADLDVVERRLAAVDLLEVFDLGAARELLAVLRDQPLQIPDRIPLEVAEVALDLLHLRQHLGQFALVLLDVEPADPAHRQGKQFVDILVGDVAPQHVAEGGQPGVHLGVLLLLALALLDLLVDAVLEEDLRQRLSVEERLLTLQIDLQLPLQMLQQFRGIAPEHLRHAHLHRAALADHRHVHRNRNRAVGVHVQPLHRLLRIVSAGRHHLDLHLVGGVVVDARNLDLVLLGRLLDRRHQRLGGGGGRNFADDEVAADDFDLRPQRNLAVAVVVFAHIHQPALLEIRVELEGFAPQLRDLRLEQFVEVVRHDLRRHADRDAVAAEHQERRHLRRKHHRLDPPPVVGVDEFGDVVVEQYLMPERRKTALDVPPRRRRTAGQDVAEIPLPGDVILLVGKHHQRIFDRRVAVRMKVHRVADDVRHLVGAPVVHLIERPEHPALHRFETVVDIRNGAVLDDVTRVFQEVPVHHHPEIVVVAAVTFGGDTAVLAFARFAVPLRLFRFGGNRSVKFRLLRFLTHIYALPGCS